MKLALFHPDFTKIGGAEILAVTQARYLRSQGIEAGIVTFAAPASGTAPWLEGVPVEVAPKRHWTDLFGSFSRVQKLRARGRRAASLMKTYQAALAYNFPCSTMLGLEPLGIPRIWQCNEPPRRVHLRAANPILSARAAAVGEGAEDRATQAFVRSLREFDQEMSRAGRHTAVRALDLESVAALEVVYAISAFSRDNARSIYGRCEESPVYPMVVFPERTQQRRGLDRSGLQVLTHSRLEASKNIDTVIRGFARFHGKHPGSRLHVVGKGPEGDYLKALAAQLLPLEAVQFHGFLSEAELQALYEACDVLALLTVDEPFGMVYPEAAARGLLLIGPDHGGPLEILGGGDYGLVCESFAPEALESAFEEVWALSDLEVESRRERADRACRQRYAQDIVGRAQMELLRRVGL